MAGSRTAMELFKNSSETTPDGMVTTGLYPQHIDMITPMFAFAPDAKITTHPVKFGSGDWTPVIGVMEGTFPNRSILAMEKLFNNRQKI